MDRLTGVPLLGSLVAKRKSWPRREVGLKLPPLPNQYPGKASRAAGSPGLKVLCFLSFLKILGMIEGWRGWLWW